MGEHRFHTPLPMTLDASIPAGDLSVETVDGEETWIEVDGDEKLVERVEVRQDGNRVVVEFRGKKPFGITIAIGDFSFGTERLRVRAHVPHGADAKLSTVSADIAVTGRLRRLDTKTTSGDVRVTGEIEQDARLKTVSGDARIDRVGGELALQSVSGDLWAGWVGGSVESKSVSGDIRLESLQAGSATFTSVSGDVAVGIAPGSFVDVDAGSVSGDLGSEVPLSSDPGEGGGGPTVIVRGKTVSGDVRVFRAA
jgi:hypothetical protein